MICDGSAGINSFTTRGRCRVIVVSAALLAALLAPAAAAQEAEAPRGGFTLRKAPTPVTDALQDFERFRDKQAWERAFRALAVVDEAHAGLLVPGSGGLLLPLRQRVQELLATLPADGRQAYRLFNDARVQQMLAPLDDAQPQADEAALLRRVVDEHFIASRGDEAADRLGDLLFERGEFLEAERLWRLVMERHPDSRLPRLRLQVKRAAALARAGRWEPFQALADAVGAAPQRQVVVAGKAVDAAKYLVSLRNTYAQAAPAGAAPPAAARAAREALALPAAPAPAWQTRFCSQTALSAISSTGRGWGSSASVLHQLVPPVALDQQRIYVNWLGVLFAIDLATGKLAWRSNKFSDLNDKFQMFAYQAEPNIYSLTVAGDRLLAVTMALDRLNHYMEPARLVCLSASDGTALWSTMTTLAEWGFVGTPLVAGDTVYAVGHPRQGQELSLIALDLASGRQQWSLVLGTAQTAPSQRGTPRRPQPALLTHRQHIYVITNNGALLAVNPEAKALEWALLYEPPAAVAANQGPGGAGADAAPPRYFLAGEQLFLKEGGSGVLCCIDLAAPALRWTRALSRNEQLVGIDEQHLYLFSDSISALDRPTRRLRWNNRVAAAAGTVRPLVGPQGVLLFGSRGIYHLNPGNGDYVGIYRGGDTDSGGGTLWRWGDRLICVSNLAVTAYDLPAGAAVGSSRGSP